MIASGVDGSHHYNDHVKNHKRLFRNSGVIIVLLLQIVLSTTLLDNVTAEEVIHRINCGTTQQVVVPPNNITWTPDQYFTPGLKYDTCGNVTTSIYCTSRAFRSTDAAPYRYNLPIAISNRTYDVRLHFAEHVRL
jgi:Malectin domain